MTESKEKENFDDYMSRVQWVAKDTPESESAHIGANWMLSKAIEICATSECFEGTWLAKRIQDFAKEMGV